MEDEGFLTRTYGGAPLSCRYHGNEL
ncbi:hypothetical protein ACK2GH_23540 [Escherichia coli]